MVLHETPVDTFNTNAIYSYLTSNISTWIKNMKKYIIGHFIVLLPMYTSTEWHLNGNNFINFHEENG